MKVNDAIQNLRLHNSNLTFSDLHLSSPNSIIIDIAIQIHLVLILSIP